MNKQIFISDTHFGVRNNSITWLESQKNFIYNQFIPYVKKLGKDNYVRVFHLGDVFDSRSSISPMICKETNKMLEDIAEACDTLTVIAGNHDFFSPIEGSDNSTSLEMLPCRWKQDNNIKIITNDCMCYDRKAVCIPWFDFHNPKKLQIILSKYPEVGTIFTHTDTEHLDKDIQSIVGKRNIVTGHIHIPLLLPKQHHYTLGSCYSLNYADANSERGFYVMTDWDLSTIEFVPNTESIRFYRINGDEVPEMDFEPQDYIEFTLKEDVYNQPNMQEAIKNYYTRYPHFSVVVEQQHIEIESLDEDLGIYNIVKRACPEHLHKKLEVVADDKN